MQELVFNETNQWHFIGKGWATEGDANDQLTAHSSWHTGADAYEGQQGTNDDLYLAFRKDQVYRDFEATFKFRWNGGHCGAGFVFRAQDTRHYYLAHFPNVAQCTRAEHFWAMISKVDGDG